MNKKVHIIIPHYNHWDLTHARLWELYKHEKDNIDLVLVIDDCSSDDQTMGGLRWWEDFRKRNDFPVQSISLDENVGFLRASNFGLKETSDPDAIQILLSNDVIIRGKFIDQIIDILENHPMSLVGGVVHSHDTGWNKFGDKLFPYVEGWLLSTFHMNWVDLGYFDEQFSPSDYEDVDLSTKAINNFYDIVALNNINLQHLGAQSIKYGDERLKVTNENKKKFEKKWIK